MARRRARTSRSERDRPGYGVTSLMVYEECPFQYFTTFVCGIAPPRSRAMEAGANIHRLIADHFRQPSLLSPDADVQTLKLLEAFKSSRFNKPPVAWEKAFVLPLDRGDVRGRIDLVIPGVDGGLELVDFKSGTPRPREEMERSLQLPLYALAAGTLFDRRPEDVRYTYYFLRDGSEIVFPGAQNESDRLIARVDSIMQAMQEGRFDPPPGCKCFACRRLRARWSRLRRSEIER